VAINRILEKRTMTQAEAARVLGVNQPKVSALKGYKLEGFSVERLMHFVTALEHDVVIEIRPRREKKGAGRVRVVGAACGEGIGRGGWSPRFSFAGLGVGVKVRVWARRRLMACGSVRIRMTICLRMCMDRMRRLRLLLN
jgi:hypothetical protein